MSHDEVMQWVAHYEDAWRAADREAVEKLFSAGAHYLRSPYEVPLVGHEPIKDVWVDTDGEVFTMAAEPVAIEDRIAVVRVKVRYGDPVSQEYLDLWVMRFDADGRVEHFEEWAYWPGKPFAAEDP